MLNNVPYIPEDAPFTPEQRQWLNGLFAGLFSSAQKVTEIEKRSLNTTIYFATQSGVAERLAKKMVKTLKAAGHVPTIASLEHVTPTEVAMQSTALFFASTYGEGDPPDAAKRFRDLLLADGTPRLETLRYSVFCLGDRTYEGFCKFGIDLDDRLRALGAIPLLPRVESDVDVDEPFGAWQQEVLSKLGSSDEAPSTQPRASAMSPADKGSSGPIHSRDNPFRAPLLERQALTTDVSTKLTMHLRFGLEDAPLKYEAGDACGIIANNDPIFIAELLASLPFSGSELVTLPKIGSTTIEEALLHHLQATRLTRKIVSAFAGKANCKKLSALLSPEQGTHLEDYIYDRGLIDLLHEYPGIIQTAKELVDILPKLAPRLYSISSSPAAHGREVHCTIAVVRYRSHNRERGGVASTMLSDRAAVGERLPIYIQPNRRFRLPGDGNTPIIMIGPGTGIAPFRAFLHERQALGSQGKNWLFFGERSAKTDFLYSPELRAMADSGHLTRLDTAFSRDQAHKVYVQDRMLEAGSQLWQWLEEGAQLYVCGDASRMAKDVDAVLHEIVEKNGGKSTDASREYVNQLQEDHRYHRDVY